MCLKPNWPLLLIFCQWHHHPSSLVTTAFLLHLLYTSNQQISPDFLISVHIPWHYSRFGPIIFHLDNFNSLLNRLPVSSVVWDPPLPWFLPTDYINPLLKTFKWWYFAYDNDWTFQQSVKALHELTLAPLSSFTSGLPTGVLIFF